MRIVLADDHSIVRCGLRHLLSGLDPAPVIDEVGSGDEVRALFNSLSGEGSEQPDLLVLDLRMPGIRGIEDVRGIVALADPTPVLVFSMLEAADEMRSVLAQGVRAFVPKSTDQRLLLNIVRLVLAGGTYLPPVLGGLERGGGGGNGADLPRFGDGGLESLPAGLTKRQQEVLRLLAEGLSNQEIGERMGLNLSTVKSHVTGILKTLNVGSRTQAVLTLRRRRKDGFSF
ncbi:response regulator transcription factor [Caenispirillum bisanense]|uniref:response regulator transcription factor n=1 Tax=Caenispirillum bisanense TaxID=414052 RepID=UPI0031DA5913